MSGCDKYKQTLGDTPGASAFEELGLVTQFIVKEILKEFPEVWVFGSRYKGGWRYCSDFDFAVDMPQADKRKALQEAYSFKFGVMIELRDKTYYEANEGKGLKVTRHDD